jgi:hypothetical protein
MLWGVKKTALKIDPIALRNYTIMDIVIKVSRTVAMSVMCMVGHHRVDKRISVHSLPKENKVRISSNFLTENVKIPFHQQMHPLLNI